MAKHKVREIKDSIRNKNFNAIKKLICEVRERHREKYSSRFFCILTQGVFGRNMM